jgi:hypothetical protein
MNVNSLGLAARLRTAFLCCVSVAMALPAARSYSCMQGRGAVTGSEQKEHKKQSRQIDNRQSDAYLDCGVEAAGDHLRVRPVYEDGAHGVGVAAQHVDLVLRAHVPHLWTRGTEDTRIHIQGRSFVMGGSHGA